MAKIMVIDDDPSTLFLMRETFAVSEGHTVQTFADADRALEALKSGGDLPGVVVLDVMLPGMDGLTFARTLAADPALKEVPLVVISADPQKAPQFQGLSNVRAFFKKPCVLEELRQAVGKAVAGK